MMAGRGCAQRTTQAPKFDCEAALSNWRIAWSFEKKDWCCKKEAKGCIADHVEISRTDEYLPFGLMSLVSLLFLVLNTIASIGNMIL